MKFSITVTLKKDVLDPQGKVVQNTLTNIGLNLKNIRQGKYFEIDIDEKRSSHSCKKYRWDVQKTFSKSYYRRL